MSRRIIIKEDVSNVDKKKKRKKINDLISEAKKERGIVDDGIKIAKKEEKESNIKSVEAKKTMSNLLLDIDSKVVDLKKSNESVEKAKLNLDDILKEIVIAQKDISDLKSEKDKLETSIKDINSSSANLVENKNIKVKKLEVRFIELSNFFTETREAIVMAKIEKDDLLAKSIELSNGNSKLRDEYDSKIRVLDSLEIEIVNTKAGLEKVKLEVSDKKKLIRPLEDKASKVRVDISLLEKDAKKATKDLDSIQLKKIEFVKNLNKREETVKRKEKFIEKKAKQLGINLIR